MTNPVLEIKLLAADDWPVLRTTRLRALRDSPHAFTSRYNAEARWTEREWRSRLDTATWLVAVESGVVIGIAGLVEGQQPDEAHHAEWVWVAPERRQHVVFRSLVDALADLARTAGLTELLLWVLEDNPRARLAYARLGFVETGDRQPVTPGSLRYERRLGLAL